MFRNRVDAGEQLVAVLSAYKNLANGLVLALPRGGVVPGSVIGRRLRIPLDIFMSQKLKAPWNPELALGALTETGLVQLNEDVVQMSDLPSDVLAHEVRREQLEIERRLRMYRGGRRLPSIEGKTVILVDDGVATGATLLAAVESLRLLGSKRLVAAIPVGPARTLSRIRRKVDDLKILERPADFMAVAQYYESFDPVADETVCECLAMAQEELYVH